VCVGLLFLTPSTSVLAAAQDLVPNASTQPPQASDAAVARADAQSDAKGDVSRTGWILFGVFGQWIAPVVAYTVPHDPPAMRLIGKTPEYTAAYVQEWKHRSKAQRVKHAWIGFGLTLGAAIAICTVGPACYSS
jgi:hypothetical protein